MAKLSLIETIQTKLSTLSKTDGQLIVTRDNASLYIDLDGNRIYISDWIDVETDTERLAMLSPLSNKYYYVVETNKIWRYISGSWVLVIDDSLVSKQQKIAGIDLSDNITVDELVTALGIDDKVDKVDGMGLSTNDYSNEEKATVAQNKIDIDELKSIQDITNTTDTALLNSYNGAISINDIFGNTEQNSTSGKNLLDCSGLTAQTINGVTFTPKYDDRGLLEYINVNGTATDITYFDLNSNFDSEKYNGYLLNGYGTSVSPSADTIMFRICSQESRVAIQDIIVNNTAISNNGTNLRLSLRVSTGYTANNLKFYPMIRLATDTDATYEPFTNGASPNLDYLQEIKSVEVSEIKSVGKNLLDMSNAKGGTISGITVAVNADGSYSYKGTAEQGAINVWLLGNWGLTNELFTLPKGTYYVKGVNLYYNQSTLASGRDGGVVTFSADQPISGVRAVNAAAGTTYNETHYPIIARSDVAVDWEPYTESKATLSAPITLNGISGVSDYIDVKRGVKVQKFGVVVFDGSDDEEWTFESLSQRLMFVGLPVKKASNNSEIPNILCNQFWAKTPSQTYNKVEGITVNTQGVLYIYSDNFNTADVSLWKAHLQSNPMTVVYELAEPIETPLSEADVEALKSLETFDGVTHIFTDSEIDAIIDLDYGTTKVGAVALKACAEACTNKSVTNTEITSSIEPSDQVVGDFWLSIY